MAVGLTPERLLGLYAKGLFPMAEGRDDPRIFVVDPEERGVLPLDGFHVSRRLARTVRQNRFRICIDSAFAEVVDGCAGGGEDRPETWINDEIRSLYLTLHAAGIAHSVECWDQDRLVGGLYGVRLGGAFFGESMFSSVRDASKVALVHLVARLIVGGFVLLDCQFMTDHLETFGAAPVPRAAYRQMLKAALPLKGDFYRMAAAAEGAEALQAISHRS